VDWFARLTNRPTRDLLAEFRDAGLAACRAGRPRSSIPRFATASASKGRRRRLDSHPPRAHELACAPMRPCSTATSMKPFHRIDHLCRLRTLQDETGRLPDVHPLASTRTTRACRTCRSERADGPANEAVSRLMPGQLPPTSRRTGYARHQDGAAGAELRRRRPSTARWLRKSLPHAGSDCSQELSVAERSAG